MIKVNYSIKQQRILERTSKQNAAVCYLQKTYLPKDRKRLKLLTLLMAVKKVFKQNVLLEIKRLHTSSPRRYYHSKFYLIALKCIKQKLAELPGEIHKSAFIVEHLKWPI